MSDFSFAPLRQESPDNPATRRDVQMVMEELRHVRRRLEEIAKGLAEIAKELNDEKEPAAMLSISSVEQTAQVE